MTRSDTEWYNGANDVVVMVVETVMLPQNKFVRTAGAANSATANETVAITANTIHMVDCCIGDAPLYHL